MGRWLRSLWLAGVMVGLGVLAGAWGCQTGDAGTMGARAMKEFRVTEAGDYLVPGSTRNTVRYEWSAGARLRAVRMEVIDSGGRMVRVDRDLKQAREKGATYAQHQWNGCADVAGRERLAEGRYRLRLVAHFEGDDGEFGDEAAVVVQRSGRRFHITFSDSELFPGGVMSGIDPATVTRDEGRLIIKQSFKDEEMPPVEIMAYDLVVEHPGVVVFLQSSPGVDYPFYLTPMHPRDGVADITYQLTMKTSPKGVLDYASNVRDWNGATEEEENKGVWQFKMSEEGMTEFVESYSVE